MSSLKDRMAWDPSQVLPQCVYCRHSGTSGGCAAFPGGIPPEIRRNQVDHRKPYLVDGVPADTGVRGDRSILFEPEPVIRPDVLAPLHRILDALP
jgi:hypothetical protein